MNFDTSTYTDLTNKQIRVYIYYLTQSMMGNKTPTLRETATALGYRSPSAIEVILKTLARKGYAKIPTGRHRAVKIIIKELENPSQITSEAI